MATPNIVPRADSEGNLGTSSKFWLRSYLDGLTIGNDASGTIVFAPEAGDTVTLASAASGAFSITTVDGGGAAGNIDLIADGSITLNTRAAASNVNIEAIITTIDSLLVNQENATVGSYPSYRLKSTANNNLGGVLHFMKDRGAASVNGDDIGSILWAGENDAQENTDYGKILVEASEVDDTDEAGKMSFFVAESNGTTSQLTAGLILEGEHATDGEVDVTIANGTASTTTINGGLAIKGITRVLGAPPVTSTLADNGSIPITAGMAGVDAGGGARTGIRFAGAGVVGQTIFVINSGGEALSFHNTEGTCLVKGIHASTDTMEAGGLYHFVSNGSLWHFIGGGKNAANEGLTAP